MYGSGMVEQTVVLPFEVPNLFAGFAQGAGLAKASASELTLEFVVKDTFLNVFKSDIKAISIPRQEIDQARFDRGWVRSKVFLRAKSMKWFADLPGCDSGEVTLFVARKDRDRAEEFVQALSND